MNITINQTDNGPTIIIGDADSDTVSQLVERLFSKTPITELLHANGTDKPTESSDQTEALLAAQTRIAHLLETVQTQDKTIAELLAPNGKPQAKPENKAPAATQKPKERPPVESRPSERKLPSLSSLAAPAKPRLGYDEFDKLVRSEMKRLAPTPGVMPGYKTWDEMRAEPLPTMLAVIRRYNCASSTELATKLGMEPPLGKQIVNIADDTAEETTR